MSRRDLGGFLLILSLVFLVLFLRPSMLFEIIETGTVPLKTQSIYIQQVDSGGLAEQTGLLPDDKIIAVNNLRVTTLDEFAQILRTTDSAKLRIGRQDKISEHNLMVKNNSIWTEGLGATISRYQSFSSTPLNIIRYYWQLATTDSPIRSVINELFIFSVLSFVIGVFFIWLSSSKSKTNH